MTPEDGSASGAATGGTGAGAGAAPAGGTGAPAGGAPSSGPGATGSIAGGPAGAAPAPVSPDWRATLPPDIAAHASLKNFKDPASLAKSWIESQGLIGRSVQLPGQNATAEDWGRIWNKLGRPESPDGYHVEIKPLPDGSTLETGEFLKHAHKIGLSNWQAQQVLGYYRDTVAADVESYSKSVDADAGMEKLRGVWGGATDKNISLAQRAVMHLGGEPLRAVLRETGVGNVPEVVIAFAKMGAMLAEDNMVSTEGLPSADNVNAALTRLMNDQTHPYHKAYWDRNHPDHKKAVDEVIRLRQQLQAP